MGLSFPHNLMVSLYSELLYNFFMTLIQWLSLVSMGLLLIECFAFQYLKRAVNEVDSDELHIYQMILNSVTTTHVMIVLLFYFFCLTLAMYFQWFMTLLLMLQTLSLLIDSSIWYKINNPTDS